MSSWYVWSIVAILFGGTALTLAAWILMVPMLLMASCCCPKWVAKYTGGRRKRITAEAINEALGALPYSSAEQLYGGQPICAICLEDFAQESRVRMLPCNHIFHDECIDRWFLEKQPVLTCPMCKQSVELVFPPEAPARPPGDEDAEALVERGPVPPVPPARGRGHQVHPMPAAIQTSRIYALDETVSVEMQPITALQEPTAQQVQHLGDEDTRQYRGRDARGETWVVFV